MPTDQKTCRTLFMSSLLPMLIAIGALGPGRVQAQQSVHAIGPSTELRVVDVVPASVLWHAEGDESYDADGAFSIGVWAIASESQPVDAGKRLIALVMVGRGDLRESPVAVEIWSDVDRKLVEATPDGTEEAIRFLLVPGDCRTDRECAAGPISLSVTVGGDHAVRMNDSVVGSIH